MMASARTEGGGLMRHCMYSLRTRTGSQTEHNIFDRQRSEEFDTV